MRFLMIILNLRQGSSVVERGFHKAEVVGSIPTPGTLLFSLTGIIPRCKILNAGEWNGHLNHVSPIS